MHFPKSFLPRHLRKRIFAILATPHATRTSHNHRTFTRFQAQSNFILKHLTLAVRDAIITITLLCVWYKMLAYTMGQFQIFQRKLKRQGCVLNYSRPVAQVITFSSTPTPRVQLRLYFPYPPQASTVQSKRLYELMMLIFLHHIKRTRSINRKGLYQVPSPSQYIKMYA